MLEHDMLPPDPEARPRALAAARRLVETLGRFSQVSLPSFCQDRRDYSLDVSAGSLGGGGGNEVGVVKLSREMCSCPLLRITKHHKKSCKVCNRGNLIFD